MRVGFTGTQVGMSPAQREAVREALRSFGVSELHHGDCIGADDEVHQDALHLGIPVVTHPPADSKKRAWVRGAVEERPVAPFLERNHAIVDETELLLAAPLGDRELLRSGTWATVRYAKKSSKHVWVISSSGGVHLG